MRGTSSDVSRVFCVAGGDRAFSLAYVNNAAGCAP
jgi:hypothetical protein